MDATTQTGTDWAGWFDRINSAAMTWYGIYQQGQPVATAGQPSASLAGSRGGVTVSSSWPILVVGAIVILGAVYLYKKA